MIKASKILSAIVAGAAALSAFVMPAAADAQEEEAVAYLVYCDGTQEIQTWEISDATPAISINGDGEYTVEYNASEELPAEVAFLGVNFEGVPFSGISAQATKITVGDTEVPIDAGYINKYVTGGRQIKVIEDWSEETAIPELEGQTKLAVTFEITGLGPGDGGEGNAEDREEADPEDPEESAAEDRDEDKAEDPEESIADDNDEDKAGAQDEDNSQKSDESKADKQDTAEQKTDDSAEAEKDGPSVGTIIVIVVIVLLLVAAIAILVILILRKKYRYY